MCRGSKACCQGRALHLDECEAGDLVGGSGQEGLGVDVDTEPVGIGEAVANHNLLQAPWAVGRNERGSALVHGML